MVAPEDTAEKSVPCSSPGNTEECFLDRHTSYAKNFEIVSMGDKTKLPIIRVSQRERHVCRNSLFIFPLDSCFRQYVIIVVDFRWFDRFILLCIVINSIMLGIYQHRAEPGEDHYFINEFIDGAGDTILWVVFCLESVLKIIAWGLIMDQRTYLRDPWNILDFVVVVSGLIEMLPGLNAGGSLGVLRLFRLLRPLRSLNAVPQLKILVNTLLKSMLKLGNVIVLGGFLFMVFSIIGIQLMSGIFYRQCHVTRNPVLVYESGTSGPMCWSWPSNGDERLCGGNYMCEDSGGYCGGHEMESDDAFRPVFEGGKRDFPWCEDSEPIKPNPETDFVHFDNIFAAFLLIFQSMTLEGWTDLMYYVEDSFSPWFAILFFITVVIFTNFFMLNVALAVVDEVQDEFRAKEDQAARPSMIEGSGEVMQDDDASDLDQENEKPWIENNVVEFCLQIATSNEFGNFIMLIIAGNVINMCLGWFTITDRFGYSSLGTAIDFIELVFLGIFVIEMGINLTAFGPKGYVLNPVTCFDGFVVIISVIETVINKTGDGGNSGLSVLRTFRLFRVMNKLANKWTKLKVLLKAMLKTGMALNYWLILFCLVLYIFTLMWISIFAKQFHYMDPDSFDAVVPKQYKGKSWCPETESFGETHEAKWTYRQDCIPRAHFDTFTWGFVTIFQVMTGENWNTIMYAGMRASEQWEGTLIPPTVMAAILFIILILFGQTLFLSLFLSMLISKFDECTDEIAEEEKEKSIKFNQMQSKKALQKSGSNIISASGSDLAKLEEKEGLAAHIQRVVDKGKMETTATGSSDSLPGQLPGTLREIQASPNAVEPRFHSEPKIHPDPAEAEDDNDDDGDIPEPLKELMQVYEAKKWPEGYAWFILSETNPIRKAALSVLNFKLVMKDSEIGVFDNIILFCILFSTTCMMIDTPLSHPDDALTKFVRALDKVFAIIFIVEMAIKFVALGLFWGKDAYLTSVWNWLDGVVVMVSIIDFATDGGGPSFLRVLRILRTFRPLRVISRNEGLKVVVETVIKSMGDLFGLVIVSLLFLLIFALIFMILLQGALFQCTPGDVDVGYGMNLGDEFVTPMCLGTSLTAGGKGLSAGGVFTSDPATWTDTGCAADSPIQWQRASADTPICIARCNPFRDSHPGIEHLCHRKYQEVEELPAMCTDPNRVPLYAAQEEVGMQFIADMQRTLILPCGGHAVQEGAISTDASAMSCMKNFCPEKAVSQSCKDECKDNRQRLGFCFATCKKGEDSLECQACRGECEAACECEEFCTPLTYDAALCLEQGGTWGQVLSQNFDNILNSMLTLFEIGTTEGWVDVMYAASDSRGIYKQPARDNQHYVYVILFPLWILLYFMFLINLAVGIIVDTFMELKDQGEQPFVTPAQRRWYQSVRSLGVRAHFFDQTNLQDLTEFRLKMYRIVSAKQFEQFIMTCIVLNTLVMGLTIFPAPTSWWEDSQTVANYMFAGIYTVEAALKLFALRWNYWNSSWNRFDFTCVVATLFGIALKHAFNIDLGAVTSVIRILRIARLFRLLKFLKELNRLFMCLLISIPKLFNVTLVLLLFLILFSILGTNIFGTAKLNDTLGPHGNFQTFFRSFVTLFRASTGEAWNEIMHDLAKDEESWFNEGSWCTPQTLFKSTKDNEYHILLEKCLIPAKDGDPGPNACAGSWNPMPAIYWVAFTLLITFMIINLVVAVILEGYEEGKENEEADNIDLCIQLWKKYDTDHRYQVPLADAMGFMRDVVSTLKFKEGKKVAMPIPQGNTLAEVASQMPMKYGKLFDDFKVLEGNEVHFVCAAGHALKFGIMESFTEEALKDLEGSEEKMARKELQRLRQLERIMTAPLSGGLDLTRNVAALKLQRQFRKVAMGRQDRKSSTVSDRSSPDAVHVRPSLGSGHLHDSGLRAAADCEVTAQHVSPPRAG